MFISDSIVFIYYNYIVILISQLDSSLASEQDYSSYRSRAGIVTPVAQTQEKQNIYKKKLFMLIKYIRDQLLGCKK